MAQARSPGGVVLRVHGRRSSIGHLVQHWTGDSTALQNSTARRGVEVEVVSFRLKFSVEFGLPRAPAFAGHSCRPAVPYSFLLSSIEF
jgi:hypothetical protein